ncbi:hypothetical protein B0H11DRAFT_2249066 [Mycena galericulata]|nr:hypothetical protein B0H11DRAFT_2249066 [Mycena galericulata]
MLPHTIPHTMQPHAFLYRKEVTRMTWDNISFTRDQVYHGIPPYPKSHFGWLIPDGPYINHRIWIKTPVKRGALRAFSVRDLETDLWMDCGRGAGTAINDTRALTLNIRRFPFDKPSDMKYTYTIVVTSQRTNWGVVHPENDYINRLAPERTVPWRGNVLIYRQGCTAAKPIINMSRGDEQLMEAILRKVFREDLANREDFTVQNIQL